MREIVTIQVGDYANFVGSHFWNFQDELLGLADSAESGQIFKSHGLNMDALYRVGETQQGIATYTPRLVSVGFQGSLGSMSSRGTLYKEVQKTPVDNLTCGIQFILDDFGGFSSVAGEFLENIADDYPNIPVLLYSVHSPDSCLGPSNRKLTIARKLHDAVSFSKQSAFCKLIVPVGLPSLSTSRISKYLYLEDQKPYHTSAVYASALHSISLPFRMEPHGPSLQFSCTSGALTINDLQTMLTGQARQNMVAILDVAMPPPAFAGTQIQQSLLEILQPLTPETAQDVEDMQALECMTIHGAFASGSKRASVTEVKEAVESAYADAVERPKFSHLSVAQCPLPIPLPFPSIFGNLASKHGELLSTPVSSSASKGSLEVHSIPMAARLRTSKAVLPFLQNRLENLRKLGIARGALGADLLGSWGFGKDDVDELGEALCSMVTKLSPLSEASSDSD